MRTYNLKIRTVGPDGLAVAGWYIADGYSLPDALTEAMMHYDLRGTYQGLDTFDIIN